MIDPKDLANIMMATAAFTLMSFGLISLYIDRTMDRWSRHFFGTMFLILLLVTDYIVIGTMTTVISFPAYCAVTGQFAMAALLCVASVIMIWKHRANLVRIANGTEIGFRSAGRGDHRVK